VGFLVNGQLDLQHGLAFGITNLLVSRESCCTAAGASLDPTNYA
jgi:hypothetical protein